MNTAKVRIRMIDLCYLSEQAVGLYKEKESRYPLSLQQGEVANTNARSDRRSVYTNKCRLTGGAFAQTTYCLSSKANNWSSATYGKAWISARWYKDGSEA
jgi:hypothetical protein